MVKNAGQKNRAKQYAAEHGITYQQAREALEAQHEQQWISALLSECGELPSGRPSRIPVGGATDGRMQWADFPTRVTEIVGGEQSGKTSAVTRIIAYLATADPREQSIVLCAGDREIDQARRRWADWPQVIVLGKNPARREGRDSYWAATRQSDHTRLILPPQDHIPEGTEEGVVVEELENNPIMRDTRGAQTIIFDDWFAASDGSLPRIADAPDGSDADWKMRLALFAAGLTVDRMRRLPQSAAPESPSCLASVIAAFRPGHTSLEDESDIIEEVISAEGTFIAEDLFLQGAYFSDSRPDAVLQVPVFTLDERGRHWAEARGNRARMVGDRAFEARAAINAALARNTLAEYSS